jgi:hypothetical protein
MRPAAAGFKFKPKIPDFGRGKAKILNLTKKPDQRSVVPFLPA